ncbi:MAG: hypothetical protein AAGG53_06195 [Cyanobacteria bacterium P01_H01_bin.152]
MIDHTVPLLNSQSTSESPQPVQMADTSADQLMDDLFDDVERALEGDEQALEKIAQPIVAEAPAAASELTLNLAEGEVLAVPLAAEAASTTELATLSVPLAPIASDADSTGTVATAYTSVVTKFSRFWTMNRALLGAAGLMLLATLGIWMQQRQATEAVATAPATSAVETPVPDASAEFLEYLRRSLEVIAQNATTTAPTAATSAGEVTIALNGAHGVGLPPVGNHVLPTGVANGLPAGPGTVNVIERVYVPYPSSQVATAVPSAIGPGGISNRPSVGGVVGTPTATQTTHSLLGVLELGDRSAALFEIEGVPQRVYIGERVGNSGWLLVSVANEEAIIRRNGEVRTLYIGQQF